jgi:hypothetical protein
LSKGGISFDETNNRRGVKGKTDTPEALRRFSSNALFPLIAVFQVLVSVDALPDFSAHAVKCRCPMVVAVL